MCRLLGVSASGFYAWCRRAPSKRAVDDKALSARIAAIHASSYDGTYGAPRIHAELRDEHDIRVSRKRVARLMRKMGLRGTCRRRFVVTTTRDGAPGAPDLVERDFDVPGPNQLWVADITYVPTWAGFLYLAVVLDAWSRRIVGWAMRTDLRAELVVEAMEMAIPTRKPTEVIHHSDHGCQYTSFAFGKRCREAGVRPSMGSVGDAYDNAMCESFFATLECELIDRRRFSSQAEARLAVFHFIESWYNPRRRHSALGYRSPINYEKMYFADSGNQPIAVH
jgi:putative transposase